MTPLDGISGTVAIPYQLVSISSLVCTLLISHTNLQISHRSVYVPDLFQEAHHSRFPRRFDHPKADYIPSTTWLPTRHPPFRLRRIKHRP